MPVTKEVFIQQSVERMRNIANDPDFDNREWEATDLLVVALQGEGGYEELLSLYEEIRNS